MDGRGKHHSHFKGSRVTKIIVACKKCGKESMHSERYMLSHNPQFCSIECRSTGISNKELCSCGYCGKDFYKRRDHKKEINFCSLLCSSSARKKEDAKWRDKEQIKLYMSEYQKKNRIKLNKLSNDRISRNRDRRLEVQSKYRKTHKEKITEIYQQRHNAVKNGDLTRKRWREIKAECHYRCLCCGEKEPEIKISIDHIVPLSMGGQHTESNVQPLCKLCNASKGVKIIDYRKNEG